MELINTRKEVARILWDDIPMSGVFLNPTILNGDFFDPDSQQLKNIL